MIPLSSPLPQNPAIELRRQNLLSWTTDLSAANSRSCVQRRLIPCDAEQFQTMVSSNGCGHIADKCPMSRPCG